MKKLKKAKNGKLKKQNTTQSFPIVRYQTDKEHGLSEEQIAERIEHRLVNDTKIKTSSSYLSIICKNIFTIFNCIWLVIAIALMCVNAWGDMLFLFVVLANTAISIFQEIKSKNTVEKLSMVSAPKIKVIRTGVQLEVKGEDLLLDDIIILENGNQIPADCTIIEGSVEANESLLTGESNLIKKQTGDTLLAGSFLVSGLCYARVEKVGKDNYIQTVAERTKDFKPQSSNLFKDLNNLIKIIILILIPVGVLTFCKEYFISSASIEESITSTSGALTGMIPAGMYLLITVGLSVGVIKLARKKTLVKNLYSIEMLARANVLCLDKTGTITDGTMNVVEVCPQNQYSLNHIESTMKTILANQKTANATSLALIEKFGKDLNSEVKSVVEFSSQRKYSATTLTNGKTCYIGAIGFIKCQISAQQKKLMNGYMEKGYRVIALVEDENPYTEKMAGKRGKLVAFFVLEDHIRKDAIETIAWFKQNNVKVKIISGDDALTVSKIAKRVGVDDSDKYVSLENMSLQEVAQIANKFTVFGRVTPEQKHVIIKTLKTHGDIVAMTGDGVNDTLALKEANCSIAMADGSEVARNISHLVLMESNFSALPSIVKEGRKIVNNVQNSSVLYLMKTLFTIMLCVTTLVLRISYPFTPKQLLLLEMFVIGLPSFILTFQPNNELIRGNFIPQVLKKSIPAALLMFVNILIIVILHENTNTLTDTEFTSLCTMLLTFLGFANLVWTCWPLNWLRGTCITISAVFIIGCISGLSRFFSITDFTVPVIVTLVTLLLCTILVLVGIYYLKEWYFKRKKSRPQKTKRGKKNMESAGEEIVSISVGEKLESAQLSEEKTIEKNIITKTSVEKAKTQAKKASPRKVN
ncbi:MAG: HAD family hydrolase [Clostridiales bacterium]|nr:HAD family hydrolase [Clostridiales bacterium]